MSRARDVADTQDNVGGAVAPFVAGKNKIINGDFGINQRGTTGNLNTPNYYSFDRWQAYRNGAVTGGTWSRVTASLDGFYYAARIQRDSGNSATEGLNLATSFETTQISNLWGNYLTLSFYARKGANFSGSSDSITSNLYSGTGTDGSLGVGFTSAAVISGSGSKILTTSWQRFSITTTAPLANTATQLGVRFNYTPTGTAGAADYFEVTGVQLEIGQTPTPFTTASGSIGGELALCQRYYYLQSSYAVSGGTAFVTNGYFYSSTQWEGGVNFPVSMRTVPTLVATTGTNYYNTRESSPAQLSAVSFTRGALNQGLLYGTVSGKTAGFAASLEIVNASGSIAFSSEL